MACALHSIGERLGQTVRISGLAGQELCAMRGRMVSIGILLATVVGGAGLTPAVAAVLTVNDPTDPGSVGDAALSLSEAIRLATGDLAVGSLSSAERAQLTGGSPGPAVSDTIRFAVNGSVALAGNGGEGLPPLTTGNDTIDGEGAVVLDGAGMSPNVSTGLRIVSSGNIVRGLTFRDVSGSAILLTAPPGGSVQGNQILSNRFTRSGFDAIRVVAAALPRAGAVVAGGVVDGTVIQGNTIETATPGNKVRGYPPAAINLLAAYASVPGTVSGAKITNTTIADNVIQDVFEGLFARAALGSGTCTDNELAGLVIRGNVFQRVNDQPCYIGTSNPDTDGQSSDNVTRDVVITQNTFRERVFDPAAPALGGGPFVSGGFLANCGLAAGDPSSIRDVTMGVEISDNVVTDRPPYGIYVKASQSCGGSGGSITQSVVQDVVIARNRVESSGTGISLTGGSSFETGPRLTNASNAIRSLSIVDNTITGNDVGIELIAGTSNGGSSAQNAIEDVDISTNVLTGNGIGLAATGGVTIASGDDARGNTISGLLVAQNVFAGSKRGGIVLQGVTASAGSAGVDNLIEAPQVSGNRFENTGGVGILLTPGNVASAARTRDNTVAGATISGNTLLDTMPGPPGAPRGVGIMLFARPGMPLAPEVVADNVIDRVATVGIVVSKSTGGHQILRNQVTGYGKKPFSGNKRRNVVRDNSFGSRRTARRAR